MQSKKEAVSRNIDAIIDRLSLGLSDDDVQHGGNQQSRQGLLEFFVDLRANVVEGDLPRYLFVARGMDHWGITGGEPLELGALISNQIRELQHEDN